MGFALALLEEPAHRGTFLKRKRGRLNTCTRPRNRPPVSVSGWAVVAPGFTEAARRYVDQIALSLRPVDGGAR